MSRTMIVVAVIAASLAAVLAARAQTVVAVRQLYGRTEVGGIMCRVKSRKEPS